MPTAADGFDADADAIQFDVTHGGTAFGTGVDIPLDIDLPGFGLKVDGGFGIQLDWSFDFGMGLSVSDGFYMTTNDADPARADDPELTVEIGAFLDGRPLDNAVITPFEAEGKLLFFKVTAVDSDRDPSKVGFQPSGLFGFLDVDLHGDSQTGRMSLDHILSTPFDELFTVDMGVEAELTVFDGAAKSVDAVANGQADIGFFAIDPKRGEHIAFTPPYVLIEGSYLVKDASALPLDVTTRARARSGARPRLSTPRKQESHHHEAKATLQ